MEQWVLQVGQLQFGQVDQIEQHEKHKRRLVSAFRIEKSCRNEVLGRGERGSENSSCSIDLSNLLN
jgi:hypothetical protein